MFVNRQPNDCPKTQLTTVGGVINSKAFIFSSLRTFCTAQINSFFVHFFEAQGFLMRLITIKKDA